MTVPHPNRVHRYIFARIKYVMPVLAGLAAFLAAQPGYAGFEWTPPQTQSFLDQSQSQQRQRPPYNSQQFNQQTEMKQSGHRQSNMPINITGRGNKKDTTQGMISRQRLRPDMPGSDTQNAVPHREQTAQNQQRIQGFGKDIPLTLALRQIMPDRYSFAFSEGVNRKTPISWEGGEDWRTTLRKSLQAKGLDMQIQNRIVRINKADQRIARQSQGRPASQRGKLTRPGLRQPDNHRMSQRHQSPGNTRLQHYNNGDPRRVQTSPKSRSSNSMAPVSVPTSLRGESNAVSQSAEQSQALSRTYDFNADKGNSLRTILQDWAQKAGVELRWEPVYDFTLRKDIEMRSDFTKAVSKALAQYSQTAPKPHGRLHTTSDNGNPVLVIE